MITKLLHVLGFRQLYWECFLSQVSFTSATTMKNWQDSPRGLSGMICI